MNGKSRRLIHIFIAVLLGCAVIGVKMMGTDPFMDEVTFFWKKIFG